MTVSYASADRLRQIADWQKPAPQGAASPAAVLEKSARETTSLDLTETAGALSGEGDSVMLTDLGVVEGLRDAALGLEEVEEGLEEHRNGLVADGLARTSLAAASVAPGVAGEVFAAVGGLYNVASGVARHDNPAAMSGALQLGAASGLLAMMAGVSDPALQAAILACEAGRVAVRVWADKDPG